MTFNSNSFTGGQGPGLGPTGTGTGTASQHRGQASAVSLALDNLLRNQLRVNDPRNAKQVAEGLLSYYKDHPQAVGLRQEVMGIPTLPQLPTSAAPTASTRGSSDTEFAIANGDVEKALQDLANNALTNDITPEMQGWADSIRLAITQGHAAARQGLDPTQRDKVLAVRRQLGEYARMARFVGSLSPGMTPNFRRLGRGLDEVSAVLLVMLGESLASVGFATGYYLLQVPLQELQQRRDAVIYALRNFNGGAQQAYGPDDWPRGIDAYRRLYNWLEQQGQGDLRSLLLENELAQTMDTLIARAQNGTSDGLRALGVTAQLDIERFRRMAIVAPGAMSEDGIHFDRSPPLEAYLQALDLFAQTFAPAGGLRLLRIARPPILLYGLYYTSQIEEDNALFDLITVRGMLATIFDGLFPSDSSRGVQPQVLLDMLLLTLDRAIDLLALSPTPQEGSGGRDETRAIAYWWIISVITRILNGGAFAAGSPIAQMISATPPANATQYQLAQRVAFQADFAKISKDYASAIIGVTGLPEAFVKYGNISLVAPNINAVEPGPLAHSAWRAVSEELRVQRSLEARWENLVRTIAIEAGDQLPIFTLLRLVIDQAAFEAGPLPIQQRLAPALPQQFEQTLDQIARKIS